MGDLRDPRFIVYPTRFLLVLGLFLFLLKLNSRRQLRYQSATPAMIENLNRIAGTEMEGVADPDTVDHFLGKLPRTELPAFLRRAVRRLIRMKVLDRWRLEDYFLVAIDGSGIASFLERHCDHCLTQKTKDGKTIYYHLVLEAKLVTANGLAISLMTEFVENPGTEATKQDCERAAFYRLALRLKDAFPQLRMCLLFDALYFCEPVAKVCRDSGWGYIATFKEGSAPARWREYQNLKELAPENRKEVKLSDGGRQEYAWVPGLEVGEERANVLECRETTAKGKSTTFVWGTNLRLNSQNVQRIADGGGRLRWKIENEGFNEQKNGGYELEHVWSEDYETSKNYYYLLQIAQLLGQLIEKGNLLIKEIGKEIKKAFGGVRKVAEYLKESLRMRVIPTEALDIEAAARIQIRLGSDTS